MHLKTSMVGVGLALAMGVVGFAHGAEPSPPQAPAKTVTKADAAPSESANVDALMKKLAAMPGLYGRFTEEKTIALLAVPLVNHGTVHYHPPGRLLRSTDKPHKSQVLLVDDGIWLREGAAKPERVDLGGHPAARSFVGSFRSLLAGDRKALSEHFELRLRLDEGEGEGDKANSWTLELHPRTKGMTKIVTKIIVRGHDEIIERLIIHEASGDVSNTRFFDVDATRRYSEEEAARLFQHPG